MSKIEKGGRVKYTYSVLAYTPAEYVQAARESYILFYQTNPATGKRERFRPTFNLNRIKDPVLQAKRAAEICKDINKLLPLGYPYEKSVELKLSDENQSSMSVQQAFDEAINFKIKSIDNKKTIQTYKMLAKKFVDWCVKMGIGDDIHKTKAHHVPRYVDFLIDNTDISNRTINNYITILRALLYELEDREMIAKNPFSNYNKLQVKEREPLPFNDHERAVISRYIKENDRYLFLAIVLEFYCCLRPKDIRFLRFGHVNLKKQTIITLSTTSKNRKTQYVTIPDALLKYLLEIPDFERYPSTWYIFGKGVKPGLIPIGQNTLASRHKKALNEMLEKGLLMDIAGKSLYNWKYLGNQALFDLNLPLHDIKTQNRHASITTTELYHRRLAPIVETIKGLTHDIME